MIMGLAQQTQLKSHCIQISQLCLQLQWEKVEELLMFTGGSAWEMCALLIPRPAYTHENRLSVHRVE